MLILHIFKSAHSLYAQLVLFCLNNKYGLRSHHFSTSATLLKKVALSIFRTCCYSRQIITGKKYECKSKAMKENLKTFSIIGLNSLITRFCFQLSNITIIPINVASIFWYWNTIRSKMQWGDLSGNKKFTKYNFEWMFYKLSKS